MRVAERLGDGGLITLDMGGTSTDVCLVRGGVAEISASANSTACRSASRASTSPTFAREAAAWPGAMQAACCGSAHGARAPGQDRPATASAALNRLSPMRSFSSAGWQTGPLLWWTACPLSRAQLGHADAPRHGLGQQAEALRRVDDLRSLLPTSPQAVRLVSVQRGRGSKGIRAVSLRRHGSGGRRAGRRRARLRARRGAASSWPLLGAGTAGRRPGALLPADTHRAADGRESLNQIRRIFQRLRQDAELIRQLWLRTWASSRSSRSWRCAIAARGSNWSCRSTWSD